jgi:serine-type D-Ala-D-Ala carboxypeptidase/endopeptidase
VLAPLMSAACSSSATPISSAAPHDPSLTAMVEARIIGDRTGACVAAAVVDAVVTRTIVCADKAHPRAITSQTPFEIGSITKTMTGALLAQFVADGTLSMEDPITDHLPPGVVVPMREAPIRLKHLVTHTSGLPSAPSRLMPPADPANPYASFSDDALLASLADVSLTFAPGAHWEYSNFGFMLLSYIVARATGTDFETLVTARLFTPLEMRAYVARRPDAVPAPAVGHLPDGQATSAWDIPKNLAGVGGVRASLDDMIRYAQAELGHGPEAVTASLAISQAPVSAGATSSESMPDMGMGWVRGHIGDRIVVFHDGGTGGFSSFIAVDRDRQRAVVVLADTQVGDTGGGADLALHLMDPTAPLPPPRLAATPASELLASLAGDYRLDGGIAVTLSVTNGTLFATLAGATPLEFRYDSYGDFYPLGRGGLLTPITTTDGRRSFTWTEEGQVLAATRLDE